MIIFGAIFFALGIGYLIADYQNKGALWRVFVQRLKRYQNKPIPLKRSGYYGVLTSLLNEQSDEGLDAFVSSMDVNTETLDVHLALGNLLRRRGEYARAVRVHENLLTRPGLPLESLHQVQLELAIDYWRSGMLDRAESILSELINTPKVKYPARWQASAYLVEIYQELSQWLDAIDCADRLTEKKFSSEPDLWRVLQAQFSCELAELALRENNLDLAFSKARQALSYDSKCVRAKLLLTEHAIQCDDIPRALISLIEIKDQHQDFIPEILKPLKTCYGNDTDAYENLLTIIVQESQSVSSLLELTQLVLDKRDGSIDVSIILLWCELLRLIDKKTLPESAMLLLILENLNEKNAILRIKSVTAYLQSKLHYSCLSCGTEYSKLQWHCVSCNSWATIQRNIT